MRGYAAGGVPASTGDFEIATGLELKELEAAAKGVDYFAEDYKWIHDPVGTEENPVVVTSSFSSRIVGATDPDDDSIIEWAEVKEGEPPLKIGAEWFVLKRVADH